MIDFKVYVDQICNSSCLFVTKLLFPFELSAAGAKRGVRSLPMRTVPSRRSTQAQPAEGRPGPSDDDDDDDDDDNDMQVREGDSAILTCRAGSGSPTPDVQVGHDINSIVCNVLIINSNVV